MSQIKILNGVDESIEWKFFKDHEVTLQGLREIRRIRLLSVTLAILFRLDYGLYNRSPEGFGREIVLFKGARK